LQLIKIFLQFHPLNSLFYQDKSSKKRALIHTPELKTRDPCKVYTAVTTARHNEDYYYDDDGDGSTG
jgi:hypothetical protein